MNMPGFSAEASAYRTLTHYQGIASRNGNAESFPFVAEAHVIPGIGGAGEGCRCPPHSTPCVPDPSSSTGCASLLVNCDCGVVGIPCWGCPGGCQPVGSIKCDGICTDVRSNPQHCGSCGHACPAGQSCSNGACVCPPGRTNCGGACVTCPVNGQCSGTSCVCVDPTPTNCNGTCTSLQDDPNNCGACGLRCPPNNFCAPLGGVPTCSPIT